MEGETEGVFFLLFMWAAVAIELENPQPAVRLRWAMRFILDLPARIWNEKRDAPKRSEGADRPNEKADRQRKT